MGRLSVLLGLLVGWLLVVGAGPAGAPPFPWRTYKDIPVAQQIAITCDGAAGMYQITEAWRVVSSSERDVFIHLGPDGQVDWVYFTEGGPMTPIRVKRVLSLAQAQAQFPDPCVWILEGDQPA